jgi:hypothetical protein
VVLVLLELMVAEAVFVVVIMVLLGTAILVVLIIVLTITKWNVFYLKHLSAEF